MADLEYSFSLGAVLGKGATGVVRMAEHVVSGGLYACKSVNTQEMTMVLMDVQAEIAAMQRVSGHLNIVTLHELFVDKKATHLVMDLCSGGDLYDYLVANTGRPEATTAFIFWQVAQALAHCHARGVVHRDVKPENMMLATSAKDGEGGRHMLIKLADFGTAVCLRPEEKVSGLAGSTAYMAPEVAQRHSYGCEADMWSLGVSLFCALAGYFPFPKVETPTQDGTLENPPVLPRFKNRTWSKISWEARDLVESLLKEDPAKRLTAAQVLKHPWITRHVLSSEVSLDNMFTGRKHLDRLRSSVASPRIRQTWPSSSPAAVSKQLAVPLGQCNEQDRLVQERQNDGVCASPASAAAAAKAARFALFSSPGPAHLSRNSSLGAVDVRRPTLLVSRSGPLSVEVSTLRNALPEGSGPLQSPRRSLTPSQSPRSPLTPGSPEERRRGLRGENPPFAFMTLTSGGRGAPQNLPRSPSRSPNTNPLSPLAKLLKSQSPSASDEEPLSGISLTFSPPPSEVPYRPRGGNSEKDLSDGVDRASGVLQYMPSGSPRRPGHARSGSGELILQQSERRTELQDSMLLHATLSSPARRSNGDSPTSLSGSTRASNSPRGRPFDPHFSSGGSSVALYSAPEEFIPLAKVIPADHSRDPSSSPPRPLPLLPPASAVETSRIERHDGVVTGDWADKATTGSRWRVLSSQASASALLHGLESPTSPSSPHASVFPSFVSDSSCESLKMKESAHSALPSANGCYFRPSSGSSSLLSQTSHPSTDAAFTPRIQTAVSAPAPCSPSNKAADGATFGTIQTAVSAPSVKIRASLATDSGSAVYHSMKKENPGSAGPETSPSPMSRPLAAGASKATISTLTISPNTYSPYDLGSPLSSSSCASSPGMRTALSVSSDMFNGSPPSSLASPIFTKAAISPIFKLVASSTAG
eukprot:TRINITY_DN32459_c0_g1_i1.p1 TRINITY_DN32459_c0_g1~~TRINITY_DN32459_c0_g1_i1.p1  ORF type:complete len:927 (+),score=107.29 TRINITY_DN32459_c0_g1_i1:361-3141(+)